MTNTHSAISDPFLSELENIVGPHGLLLDEIDVAPFLTEPRGAFRGRTRAVVLPASTAEVSAIVTACAKARVPMVPAGGGTGLCGGAVPSQNGHELVIGLGRLRKIRALDAAGFTVTVEAGCVLDDLRQAAADAGLLFPLSLGAQGSCQIGGNISTNAGGTQVLRYGMITDLVLGLEVVLPDGQVLDLLRGLRKDNTGYHLRRLFCGAEGTLGIVTAAVLALFPKPKQVVTGLVAVAKLQDALSLLSALRSGTGDALSALEFVSRPALEMVLRHIPGTRDPFSQAHPQYVLFEATSSSPHGSLQEQVEHCLGELSDVGLLLDAAIASGPAQAQAFWHLRESIPEAQKPEGLSVKHDVSLPIGRMAEFVHTATAQCQQRVAGIRPVVFGHVGDGNVHFNLSQPPDLDPAAFAAERPGLTKLVHDLVMSMGGSFSAEHGIGQLKKAELLRYRSAVEVDLMRRIKASLDPFGLMNPGKVV